MAPRKSQQPTAIRACTKCSGWSQGPQQLLRLAPALTHLDCVAAPTCCSRLTDGQAWKSPCIAASRSSALFRSGTHQALQAVKKVKTGVLSFQPLGSLQLESRDPNLLSYLLSPHSVPVGTQKTKQVTHAKDLFLQCNIKHQKIMGASSKDLSCTLPNGPASWIPQW